MTFFNVETVRHLMSLSFLVYQFEMSWDKLEKTDFLNCVIKRNIVVVFQNVVVATVI